MHEGPNRSDSVRNTMRASAKVALAIAPFVVLALAGCTGGDPTPGSSAEDTPAPDSTASAPADEPAGGGDTACLSGAIWGLDVADGAAQLGAHLSSSGLAVISSEGVGSHRIIFTGDGLVSSDIDVTNTISVDASGGLVMTLVQTQSGESGGEWYWVDDSNVVTFDNWDNGTYQIQSQTLINDTPAPNQITIPTETLAGSKMQVLSCTPDTLMTQAEGSPFTQTWHAVSE